MAFRDNQADRVQRVVDLFVGKPGREHTVTLSQTYGTGIHDLWDACTSAERVARWLGPVSGDFTLGGRYQIEGNAGGSIQRCDPPKELAITWEYGGEVSHVEVRLKPEGDDATRFELRHHAPETDFWNRYGPGATGTGWDFALLALAGHVEGEGGSRDEEEQWFASAEGQRFTADVSQRWSAAAVAAGDDPTVAALRARRTTAAFTGQEEPE